MPTMTVYNHPKIVAYKCHQLQTAPFKFVRNFSHQQNLFHFAAVDIFRMLDLSDYICTKFLFSILCSTDRSTMTSCKICSFTDYGVAIISYRDNHLSITDGQEKYESELPMSGILVF